MIGRAMMTAVLVTVVGLCGTAAPVAQASYFNGTATWNIAAAIDTQLGITYGGFPAGTGIHFALNGTSGVTFSNATATSADLTMNSLSLSGTMSIVGGGSYAATATFYTPSGTPIAPTGNVGQLNQTPTASYFDPFVKISVASLGLNVYSGQPSGPQGAKALKQEGQTNSNVGVGTYDNTRTLSWVTGTNGSGTQIFTPTIGSQWVVTPEPASLSLLVFGLSFVLVRRR